MNVKYEPTLQNFLENVAQLYKNIDSWLQSTTLKPNYEYIELREEAFGTYNTQKMAIQDEIGVVIANVVPVAASVIGANGRVDLIGNLDKVIIVYLEYGGPTLTTTLTHGDQKELRETRFYKGIEEPGWYWIENSRLAKAHKVNKELFYEILTEVSDYEIR